MRATETIYREMLVAYAKRRGGQLQEDCDLSVRLWAAAAQIQALEAQAEWVLGQSFPQTAAGVYLDRHGAMRGIVRQAPSRATGQLTFRLSNAQASGSRAFSFSVTPPAVFIWTMMVSRRCWACSFKSAKHVQRVPRRTILEYKTGWYSFK